MPDHLVFKLSQVVSVGRIWWMFCLMVGWMVCLWKKMWNIFYNDDVFLKQLFNKSSRNKQNTSAFGPRISTLLENSGQSKYMYF